jgi:hypothetical protein
MPDPLGEDYGYDTRNEDPPKHGSMKPGEGENDAPATTGTHRGWGDPQEGEQGAPDANENPPT